jgi:hypothetical protein
MYWSTFSWEHEDEGDVHVPGLSPAISLSITIHGALALAHGILEDRAVKLTAS